MRLSWKTIATISCAFAAGVVLPAVGCGGSDDGAAAPSAAIGAGGATTTTDGGPDGTAGTATSTGGKGGAHGGSGGGGASGSAGKPAASGGTCNFVSGEDPSTLGPACCDKGAAHCVPSTFVDPAVVSYFTACTQSSGAQGICVGDTQIKQGSAYQPAPCNFTKPNDGVCLSACIPAVLNDPASSLLNQGSCETGELCVPCVNPLTGKPTGACDLPPACFGPDGGAPDGGTAGSGGGTTDGGGITCPYEGPPLFDPSTLPACSPACNGAHCLPAALVPMAQQSQLASCTGPSGPGFCTPDELIASGGESLPPSCVSVAGAEGRCLSTCVPAVAAQAAVLPKSTCADGHLCAPCYNPFAADPTMPTGACSVACDAPKSPPTEISCPYTGADVVDPSVFPDCAPACGGAHCVPDVLIPDAQKSQLAACPGGYCAPDSLTKTGGKGVPPTCQSIAGAEGRCLSTCLPAVADQAAVLPKSTCADGEVCAPCYNPFAADPNAPTGACSVACDMPADPPTIITCPYSGPALIDPATFPACSPACGGAHCLPAALVPMDQQSKLTACSGGFCTPDTLIASGGKSVPPTCDPFPGSGAEGRCLSECIPAVDAQKSQLVQSSCNGGELCVPCSDPFSGADTGACRTSCDAPKQAAFTFPKCCSYMGQTQGTCIPAAQLSSDQKANLKQETCPASGASYFCVPDEYLPNGAGPSTCTDPVLGAGACVSKCANLPPSSIVLMQYSCPANHVCAPCSQAPTTPGCP